MIKEKAIFSCGALGGEALPMSVPCGLSVPPGSQILGEYKRNILYVSNGVIYSLNMDKVDVRAAVVMHLPEGVGVWCATSVGKLLVFAASDGLRYARYENNGEYTCLGLGPESQPAEFRLVFEPFSPSRITVEIPLGDTETASSLKRRLDSGTSPTLTASGNSAVAVANITDTVAGRFLKEVNSQVHSRGRYYQPFFVRYALRLYDGSWVGHSAPVLLIPNATVPLLSADSVEVDEKEAVMEATIGLGNVARCRLEMRFPEVKDGKGLKQFKDIVKSVDIAVTQPVYLWRQDGAVNGFSTVAAKCSVMSGQRPGADGTVAGEPDSHTDVFIGHYARSESEPSTDRYIGQKEAMDSRIWNLDAVPESEFATALTSSALFHVIASVPVDEVKQDGVFRIVLPSNGSLLSLAGMPVMTDGYRTLDRYVVSKGMMMHNSRLCCVPDKIIRGAPAAVCSYLPSSWPGKPGRTAMRVKFEGSSNGDETVRVDDTYVMGSLTQCRWLFYPDPEARELIFEDGRKLFRVRLARHPYLNGAYWYGGMDAGETIGPEVSVVQLPESGVLEAEKRSGDILITSGISCPFLFPPSMEVPLPSSGVVAVMPALRRMSEGQFGAFPIYIFTADKGIYAIDSTVDGKLQSLRLLSEIAVKGKPVVVSGGVAFMSDEGVFLLKGSELTRIDVGVVSQKIFALSKLPWLEPVFAKVGLKMPDVGKVYPLVPFGDVPKMGYDPVRRLLFILGAEPLGNAFHVWHPEKGWGIMENASEIVEFVNCSAGMLIVDAHGNIARFDDAEKPNAIVVYETDFDETPKRFAGVQLLGEGGSGDGSVTVCGRHGNGRWHLVGSYKGERFPPQHGTPYSRYLVIITSSRFRFKLI